MTETPTFEAMREFIRAQVALEVTRQTAALTREAPKVTEGPPGKDGRDGVDGKDGRDGVDGTPGEKGERGADGIGTPEELDARIELRFRDLVVRSFADVYRDIYRDGEEYTRGDVVTWGGSLWLAKAETRSKPGTDDGWKLIVKKGADARK